MIAWKSLSHPNILPLLGVSISTDPRSFRIVSDWMRNGNVMEYTRSNPEVNRLQLVSPLANSSPVPLLRPITVFSSLGSCLARPTFMSSESFMAISRGSVGVRNPFYPPANRQRRQTFSLTTTVLPELQTSVS